MLPVCIIAQLPHAHAITFQGDSLEMLAKTQLKAFRAMLCSYTWVQGVGVEAS